MTYRSAGSYLCPKMLKRARKEGVMLKSTETHPIRTEFMKITVDEKPGSSTTDAYLAQPVEAGSYPGVIVGFELFGLTGHIRTIAERIARLGYVVIAPDFYHRTSPRIELEATA